MHHVFGKDYIMDFKAVGKCFIEQESGLVIDEAGNKLPAKTVMFCKTTPFVITEEGGHHQLYRWQDVNCLSSGQPVL